MKNAIQILDFFYFNEGEVARMNPELRFEDLFNAKVKYTKNGKRYLACIYLDYSRREVYFGKQPKECKVLQGLEYAIKLEKKFI